MKKIAFVIVYTFFALVECNVAGALPSKVSIITSLYKGDHFIEGFLQDIVQQTIFDQCELIILNANSPGNEEPIIREYIKLYPNIRYKKLEKDPGLYGVWNKAICMARGEYITNASVNDRLAPTYYAEYVCILDQNPHVDLVYSDVCVKTSPNKGFIALCIQTRHNIQGFAVSFGQLVAMKINSSTCLYYHIPLSSRDPLIVSCSYNHSMWRRSLYHTNDLLSKQLQSVGDK